VKVSRGTNLVEILNDYQSYDFVINCVSSRATSDSIESNESNFEYPRRIFDNVQAGHWIQLESYFQLQIQMGRRDPYSLDKQKFSEYLDARSKIDSSPVIHHLFMPHIFGEGDRPGRLILSSILAMKSGLQFETSSGGQYLPILHLSDAVKGIASFLDNPTSVASCSPFWHGQVKDLLTIISSLFDAPPASFGKMTDPIDVNFPQVQFPSTVNNWWPEMQLNEFLEWVRVQSG
jgi:nucleoside-diphosphate-sugar epimerase